MSDHEIIGTVMLSVFVIVLVFIFACGIRRKYSAFATMESTLETEYNKREQQRSILEQNVNRLTFPIPVATTIKSVQVIPWEVDQLGINIKFSNGQQIAFPLSTIEGYTLTKDKADDGSR